MARNVKGVIEKMKKKYGVVKHDLTFSNPLQLLVAAMLSPQVRDEVVSSGSGVRAC